MRVVYKKILNHFGPDRQLICALEELSELTQVIAKIAAGKDFVEHNLVDEIADVEIMLTQIKVLFEISDSTIENRKSHKIVALLEKIYSEERG